MVVFVALRRTRASGLNEGVTLLCLLALKPLRLLHAALVFAARKPPPCPRFDFGGSAQMCLFTIM